MHSGVSLQCAGPRTVRSESVPKTNWLSGLWDTYNPLRNMRQGSLLNGRGERVRSREDVSVRHPPVDQT